MIFNEMNTSTTSYEAVQESPYELGIGGALMHVYENECNYNALMKAAALSEMKYYNETGGDLFVQEAGALSGFFTKVKEFFKKIIEKIKSIFKKFVAKINQYTMDDKDFVKKYQTELTRKNLKDFEFEGYKFPMNTNDPSKAMQVSLPDYGKYVNKPFDSDEMNDIIEKNRTLVFKSGVSNQLTESEFRDELKEALYGDKETLDNISIREYINIISDTKKAIKDAEKDEKEITRYIEKEIIKKIEDTAKEADKGIKNDINSKNDMYNDDNKEKRENTLKFQYAKIDVWKACCNDITVYFGAKVKAIQDRNRQAKAICVKALSYNYKNEAAYSESGYNDDIFSGVEIV